MARFIAEIEGQSNPTTRIGSEGSGIRSHTRGWNLGVKVHGDGKGERDRFLVQVTGGSHNPSGTRNVCTIEETDEGTIRLEFPNGDYILLDSNLSPLFV